ncbi:facilitated trehalose transporter Tret1 [Anabrus simplex]|uniref:facilitated trehalose transporter Tret1 n=1 Tax=Anabrus simplex TaxID=316456 RepID=UPI0035A3A1FE
MDQGNDKMLYTAALAVSLTTMVGGMFLAWTSPMLPILLADDSPVPMTKDQSTWIVSFLFLGILLSTVPTGFLGTRLGSKRVLLCSIAPAVMSTELSAAATSFPMLLISRLLAGISVGMCMTMTPSYLTDIARDENRGLMGLISHVNMNVGSLIAYSVGPYLEFRIYQLLCSIVPIIFLVIFVWMPESPYFLLTSGRRDEAARTLATLRGHKDTVAVQHELDQMVMHIGLKENSKGKFRDLFSTKGNRLAFANLILLISTMVLSGHGVIISYAGMIFKESGNSLNPEASTIILGTVQLISNFSATFVVDKFGRRPLIIISALGMAISLAPEIIYFSLKGQTDTSDFGWVPLVFLILYVIMYSIGLGAVPMIIISELFPINVKEIALAIGALLGGGLAFVITEIYLIMAQNLGLESSFLLSAVCCGVGTIFLYIYLPETKGKSLAEIQAILNGKKNALETSESAYI